MFCTFHVVKLPVSTPTSNPPSTSVSSLIVAFSAAKVKALMNGRYNVSYSDINELALPVLRHRIKLTFEAVAERISADEIINMIVDELSVKQGLKAPKEEAPVEEAESKKRGLFGRK